MFNYEDCRRLTRVCLADVLGTAKSLGDAIEILVVSSDTEVLRQSAAFGANLLAEPVDGGVNAAVNLALEKTRHAERWLILPSDIPFVSREDLERVLELGKSVGIVISPSRNMSGTNILLMRRDSRIPLSYDEDSFWNHLRSAASRRLRVAVFARMSVMLDLDTRPDIKVALRSPLKNQTTMFLSRKLGRSELGRGK